MKCILLIFLIGYQFASAQNSGSSYSTSKPIKTNIGETMDDIYRNDLREREFKRNSKNNRKTYTTQGERILIYGGDNNDTFLGCINCDKFDKESIWNTVGDYGSSLGKYSIWNSFKDYGGNNGKYSPFNKFSSNPPILIDSNGNFYGYFTVNKFHKDRRETPGILYILDNWEIISSDVNSAYIEIFEK